MTENQQHVPICRSVFKNGEETVSRDDFMAKWIELINRREKERAYVHERGPGDDRCGL